MKKLLSLLAFAGMLFVVSCSDDDEAALPTLTAPSSATTGLGMSGTAVFSYTAESGVASIDAVGTGVTIDGTDGDQSATSGDITVSYTVDALGTNSIVLTLTDNNGTSVDATAIIETSDFTTTEVTENITEDVTWEAGVYILNGRIAVEAGATLTIEAGTIIKGAPGELADASVLLVARGATLNAMGTADAPIVFTAEIDPIQPFETISTTDPTVENLWGGVIINGNAPISAQNDNDQDVTELQIEGIPTTDTNGLYGGSDAADNSGTITYISIRHGGTELGSGNEINGLTLGGVGSGTTISHVEIVANQDDGIEWFGGNVDIDNVVIWNAGDDGLDTDQDWVGTCTNFVIVTPDGSAFELDGPEGSQDRTPAHQFDGGVVFAGADIDHLIDWDGSTDAGVSNVYFFGLEADYVVTADFEPIESFGGDGAGTTESWEVTLAAGTTLEGVFGASGAAITEEVSEGNKTVGPAASDFDWSWAGASGALSGLGF